MYRNVGFELVVVLHPVFFIPGCHIGIISVLTVCNDEASHSRCRLRRFGFLPIFCGGSSIHLRVTCLGWWACWNNLQGRGWCIRESSGTGSSTLKSEPMYWSEPKKLDWLIPHKLSKKLISYKVTWMIFRHSRDYGGGIHGIDCTVVMIIVIFA